MNSVLYDHLSYTSIIVHFSFWLGLFTKQWLHTPWIFFSWNLLKICSSPIFFMSFTCSNKLFTHFLLINIDIVSIYYCWPGCKSSTLKKKIHISNSSFPFYPQMYIANCLLNISTCILINASNLTCSNCTSNVPPQIYSILVDGNSILLLSNVDSIAIAFLEISCSGQAQLSIFWKPFHLAGLL